MAAVGDLLDTAWVAAVLGMTLAYLLVDWDDIRARTTNVGQALQHAMREIEKANQRTLYGIFGDAQWTNKERLSDELLRDLEKRPRLWVWALPRITGENPIPEDAGGNITRMSELWLQWGRARGLTW